MPFWNVSCLLYKPVPIFKKKENVNLEGISVEYALKKYLVYIFLILWK